MRSLRLIEPVLKLPAAHRHGEVGKKCVLRLAGVMQGDIAHPTLRQSAIAIDTPSIALALSTLLFAVPSSEIISPSISAWRVGLRPIKAGPIFSTTFATAFRPR